MNIDKTDGCQVFVQKATGLATEFVTAKSSEVNICLVEENGEYVSIDMRNHVMATTVNYVCRASSL